MTEAENSKWLLPVLGSSICWAISDVLCDICIDEEDDEDDNGYFLIKSASKLSTKTDNPSASHNHGDGKLKIKDLNPANNCKEQPQDLNFWRKSSPMSNSSRLSVN